MGLIISVIGLGLVFAALALLWGLTRLLTNVLADRQAPAPQVSLVLEEADLAEAQAAVEAAAELTEERARVAAIVAGALLSNALPLLFEAPPGPAFEHGRVAPSWVTSNRARALQTWQKPRMPERSPRNDE
jgi:Na+-transporting methylmalonyl-CoA/oxaloacetate decarboxylase gamma subunit